MVFHKSFAQTVPGSRRRLLSAHVEGCRHCRLWFALCPLILLSRLCKCAKYHAQFFFICFLSSTVGNIPHDATEMSMTAEFSMIGTVNNFRCASKLYFPLPCLLSHQFGDFCLAISRRHCDTFADGSIVTDRESGQPKGFGFCYFADIESARSAVRQMDRIQFRGRTLRVALADEAAAGTSRSSFRFLGVRVSLIRSRFTFLCLRRRANRHQTGRRCRFDCQWSAHAHRARPRRHCRIGRQSAHASAARRVSRTNEGALNVLFFFVAVPFVSQTYRGAVSLSPP